MKFLDFPQRKADIFQPDDSNYFLSSNHFSYLCTYDDIQGINKWTDFPGAYVLVTYKRYALVVNGDVVFRNTNFKDGHAAPGRYGEKGYVIISNLLRKYYIQSWRNYLYSYEIRRDTLVDEALNPVIYPCANDALRVALAMSENDHLTYMVAQWFDDCDRH